jgi:hypothetical protein
MIVSGASAVRSAGHCPAKPGCSGSRSTSASGTQATSLVSSLTAAAGSGAAVLASTVW